MIALPISVPGWRQLVCRIVLSLCLATVLVAHAQEAALTWGFGAESAKAVGVQRVGNAGDPVGAFVGNSSVQWGKEADAVLRLGKEGDVSVSATVFIPAAPRAGDEFTIVCKGDRGSNPRLLLKVHSNGTASIRLAAAEAVTVEGKSVVTDGKWHHVCAVLDRDAGTYLYVDGERDAEGAKTDSIDFRTASPLCLGKSYQSGSGARRFLRGAIGDVKVFAQALSVSEIARLAARVPERPAVAMPKLAPPPPDSGSKRPGGQRGVRKATYPKIISDIVDGKAEQVVRQLAPSVTADTTDLEAWYVLAVAHAQTGAIAESARCAAKAVELGLPIERFLAGPRDLLKPLIESEALRELLGEEPPELLHGPLLGSVTRDSVSVWVRTRREVEVLVVATPAGANGVGIESIPVPTTAERDHTAVVRVSGLTPATEYRYRVLLAGVDVGQSWTFRTFPKRGTSAPLKIAFGGGAGFNPHLERMWTTIGKGKPDALLLLGDNVYIDNPTRPAVQRYCYYRRQSRPEFRGLTAACPVYAIWDDHDFTTNDRWGGPELRTPEWKIPVYKLFTAQWNNPAYGGGLDQPGCWFSTQIGEVDLIMLDGRYYRDAPSTENPSMLGPAQKAWLFRTLKQAKGAFKLLASPVPWAKGTKPGSRDTWDGYAEEREEIFRFIEANRIDGVVLLSADRHRSDVWQIEREEGYDLFEFESSRLTNVHKHGPMKGSLFSYNAKCSYGLLSFDFADDDPTLTYTIIDIDGETIHTFDVKRSRLGSEGTSE